MTLDKRMQIRVFDHYVLTPLQLDELSFDDLHQLLKREDLPAQRWFMCDLTDETIAFALRRAVRRGFVAVYPDATVGAPEIDLPPRALMSTHWFGLTEAGSELFKHAAPWDYMPDQWIFPRRAGILSDLVEDLRTKPEKWLFQPVSRRSCAARGLAGFTNHLSFLKRSEGGKLIAHVIEQADAGTYRLLHGHFRPIAEEGEAIRRFQGEEPCEARGVQGMTLPQKTVDLLRDDVEDADLLIKLLNSDDLDYRPAEEAQFSTDEVERILEDLRKEGRVLAFREQVRSRADVFLVPAVLSEDVNHLWYKIA